MKKPALQEVVCPNCHGTQEEPKGAISTNCRHCGKYFKVTAKSVATKTEGRTPRSPKDNREVRCVKCGAPNMVASAALSTQCGKCGQYLELGDKFVRGVQTAKIAACDDVFFEDGCSFKGMEAVGRVLDVRGKVFSRLRGTEEIIARAGCALSGELRAPVVRIERGSTVTVEEIECDRLLVSGAVGVSGELKAGEIVLNDGAAFTGTLNIPDTKLTVSPGANVQFDSILCAELAVEGHVKLSTLLTTERVVVLNGGTLTAPTVRAARIEVNPGGLLQASLEKYTPPERPKPPEPVPQAEAETEEKTGVAQRAEEG
jgi:cytoskeletal protein CcmA (bactofilin family)/ribosomal protein S27AE